VLKVRGDDQQVVSVSRDEFDSILKDTHPDLKVESVTKYY
jgi:predicted component of type VI protein secretion system